jgi:hypothetical protein
MNKYSLRNWIHEIEEIDKNKFLRKLKEEGYEYIDDYFKIFIFEQDVLIAKVNVLYRSNGKIAISL